MRYGNRSNLLLLCHPWLALWYGLLPYRYSLHQCCAFVSGFWSRSGSRNLHDASIKERNFMFWWAGFFPRRVGRLFRNFFIASQRQKFIFFKNLQTILNLSGHKNLNRGLVYGWIFLYLVQHCFVCRFQITLFRRMLGWIEPRTVATGSRIVWCCYHSARSRNNFSLLLTQDQSWRKNSVVDPAFCVNADPDPDPEFKKCNLLIPRPP